MSNCMKSQMFSLLFLLFFSSACQLFRPKKFDLAKFTPPNGVRIGSGLYLDETEIANIHWLEFLYYARQDSLSPEDYQVLVPDTTVWTRFPYDSIFALDSLCRIHKSTFKQDVSYDHDYSYCRDSYLRYPGYRYYPVVGISREQAQLYSLWRSEIVNEISNEVLVKENQPYRVVNRYRLPRVSELNFALNQHPIGLIGQKNWGNTCQAFRDAFPYDLYLEANVLREGRLRDTLLASPNNPFFYHVFALNSQVKNLIGNAAELTAEPGISWGGSCFDVVERDQLQKSYTLPKPDHKTGFRCICDLSVVSASTFQPQKWTQKPEVKALFEVLRTEKVLRDSMEGRWTLAMTQRHLKKNSPTCPIYPGPVFFGTTPVQHGEEIVFGDTLNTFYLPDWKGPMEVHIQRGKFPISTFNVQGSAFRISPLSLKDANGIQIFFQDEEGCKRLYFPFLLGRTNREK
jgi:hypothetical protein